MSSDPLWFLSDEQVTIPTWEGELLPIDDFDFLLHYFESYLSAMEKFLEQEATLIRKGYQSSELLERLGIEDYLEKLEDYFPDLLRKSLFVAIYTAIETELIRWCDRAQKRKKLLLAPRELAGSAPERAKTYITKELGMKLPPEWAELKDYEKLRHCLVHAQGHLKFIKREDDAKHLKEYIRRQRHLQLSNDEVTLDKGFCEEVIKNSTLLFKKLDEAFT